MATPPFNIDETSPADDDAVSAFPAVERAFRDTVEDALAVEHDFNSAGSSARHKFGVGNTTARNAITNWVVGSIWFNTATSPATLQRVVSVGPVVWEDVVNPANVAMLGSANTFTAVQTIATGTTGYNLILSSTESGASAAAGVQRFRNSSSPAGNDVLSQDSWTGRNSAAAMVDYALDFCVITSPTSGSEDSRRGIRSLRAGANSDWYFESGTLRHSSQALPGTNGALGATDVLVAGVSIANTVIQTVIATPYTTFTTVTAASDAIPFDDTIPQQTEGFELFNIAFTPKSASSVIMIRVTGLGAGSTGAVVCTTALFKDSGANALKASGAATGDNETIFPHVLEYSELSGSTSTRNYKIRVGPNSGNMYVNGLASGARRYGGASSWTMVIEERL